MLRQFKILWLKFVNQGTSPEFSRAQNIAVQNTNAVLLWAFMTVLLYLADGLISWDLRLLSVNGITAICYLAGFYLIRLGRPTLGAVVGILGANQSIFLVSDAVGKDSFTGLFAIAALFAAFLMINGQRKKTILFMALVSWMTFVGAFVTPDHSLLLLVEPRWVHSPWLPILITPLITFLMVFHTYSLFNSLLAEAEQRKIEMFHQSRMAALGEMASGIAHEINNPLQIIGASAFTIQEKIKAPTVDVEALKRASDRIETTTFRIAKIVTGLLKFSRGDKALDREPARIKEIILSTLELCQEKIKSNGVEVTAKNIQDHKVIVRPTQISQILLNLLNNSLDAVSTVNSKWIDIKGFYDGKKYQIEVTDGGARIPEKVAEKMMQPFFTTKPVGFGTGLGLSISKGIIEEHGGRIYYDPTYPDTKFVIEIPADIDPLTKSI